MRSCAAERSASTKDSSVATAFIKLFLFEKKIFTYFTLFENDQKLSQQKSNGYEKKACLGRYGVEK